MLPLLVLLGTIAGAWYLLIVRPQKEQQTRHGRLVERLQVGDHVLTVGGIYGRVTAIEASSVVLELAPGLTSRIATDGIARIVHGGEASLPAHSTDGRSPGAPTPRQALDDDMQHPHPQHTEQQTQQPTAQFAPAAILPPQPFATPHVAPPPPPAGATTFRAQVVPALPTFEPRPWGDLAPRGATHAPQPMQPSQPYAGRVPGPAVPQPAPLYASTTPPAGAAPQPMPVHAPFAQPYAQPVHAPQLYAQPMHLPQPHARTQPTYAPQPYAQPMHAPAPPPHAAAPTRAAPDDSGPAAQRRGSRAPQGMGSSLRLDDPSLRDTISRARDERAELAAEYRRLSAPLVQVDEAAPAPPPPPGHGPQPTLVGHDPSGAPLFAAPGAPAIRAIEHYPAPARPIAAEHGVPRPTFAPPPPPGQGDPALQQSAFQRQVPWAAGTAPGVSEPPSSLPSSVASSLVGGPAAHAHAHA